jgi:predicted ATPase
MARLDALGPIKDIVQVASAIGREFSFDLLSAVVGRSSEELRRALETLVDAGILHQRGSWPHAIFMFKHALIQDAAYGTLLRGPRQQLHARIADVLSLYFPEVASSLPEVLAQHYSSAGLTQQEVAFWRAAGERSVSRSSLNEAIAHFANGLSAISRLENDPRRHELELDFRLNLAAVLVMAKGWYDPEYRQQIALARALAERLGDPKRLCWALYAQWVPLFNQAAHDLGREAAQEFMNTVERIDCNITKSMAFYCVGATGFCRGEFISARESLEQCLALDDPNEVQAIIAFAGRDNVVPTLGHLGQTYAFLGYFTKAKECLERSNNRGGLFSHAPSMAFAQHNRVILSLIFRDHPGARIATDAVLGLAGQHDLPLFRAFGEIYSNWLQVEAENGFDGVKRMRDGLIAYRDMGFRLFLPRWFYMLADAYRTTGQIEEGLRTIDQALSVIEETEERAYEAEIHRLKGELLLAASAANIDAAQSCFLRAMDVARRQSARTWELRAATSLARCLRMQTGGDAARAALAPIYAWFTDGFDLPDLTEARSLLQDLQE